MQLQANTKDIIFNLVNRMNDIQLLETARFMEFIQMKNNSDTIDKTETNNDRRQEAFERFMQYGGTLSADIDYKKELNDYREEQEQ